MFKDYFSSNSKNYAQFRPGYPEVLFKKIVAYCEGKDQVLDIGTGNGQAAVELSKYFQQVTAIDPSEKQIKQAMAGDNIHYYVASAEKTGVADQSIDLVTVAQAAHWFNFDAFYEEINRILKSKGSLAIWTYQRIHFPEHLDPVINHFYTNIVGSYWPKERSHVDAGYSTIPFPMEQVERHDIPMTFDWDKQQLFGYVNTWSACQQYEKQHGESPLPLLEKELNKHWPGDTETIQITFPLVLIIGRK